MPYAMVGVTGAALSSQRMLETVWRLGFHKPERSVKLERNIGHNLDTPR
jgi:hypothetical protein